MAGHSVGRKIGRNEKKCQVYLSSRMRIKNKTRELKKRVKNYKNEETREKMLLHTKIGRKREVITNEKHIS